jgi:transcriptional regulator with XRE-family HTH domain
VRINSIHDPRYKRIVQRLIKARIDAGLTQEELAAATGLSQPDISKIEKCQRRLDILEAIDWIRATQPSDLDAVARTLDPPNAEDQS